MALVLRNYVNWVSNHPNPARQIEQSLRTFFYFFVNPDSLVQVEGGYTAVNALNVIHTWILREAPFDSPFSKTIDQAAVFLFRVLKVVQCLGELIVRRRFSHHVAWDIVLMLQVLKVLILMFLKRSEYRRVFRAIQARLQRSSTPANGHPRGESENEGDSTEILVPQVVVAGRFAPRLSIFDWFAFVLDQMYLLRPIALAMLCRRASPSSPTLGTWSAWRTILLFDIFGAVATGFLQPRQTPTVSDDSAALALENPSDERTRLIGQSIFRDPFFSVILRGFVEAHFVNGWLNRRVPLLGSLLATMTQYFLSMQQSCHLYTAGF